MTLTDPVSAFTLMLGLILIVPMIAEKLHLPDIVALILTGAFIGPHGLGLLDRVGPMEFFGTVGLLYIFILAGLEIDLGEFKKNRYRSLAFGALSFLIPQLVGTLTARELLHMEWPSAILLASLLGSHTLLTYPMLGRLGISQNRAVTITVGGTIIADTSALLVLAVIAGSTHGPLDAHFFLRGLLLPIAAFVAVIFFGVPRLGRWFFKFVGDDGGRQYLFVLAVVFLSALLAHQAGIETVIGAFLAGLALNRLIPRASPLMNRVEFVGQTLFVPFFLLGVGMLMDFHAMLGDHETLKVGALMTLVAIVTKYMAAFLTQIFFGYNTDERHVIFGLSNSRAPVTLAAVLVGFNLGLFGEAVLNGTLIMIMVTCLVSALVTVRAGRRLALHETLQGGDIENLPQRILVPIANPATIGRLMELALLLKDPDSTESVYPLMVVRDQEDPAEAIHRGNRVLQSAITQAAAVEQKARVITRVDLSVAGGVNRAIKELMITDTILGWNGQLSATDRLFGGTLDNILRRSNGTIFVCKINAPLNTLKNLVIVVPPNAELEIGFARWLTHIQRLATQLGAKPLFLGGEATLRTLGERLADLKPPLEHTSRPFHDWHGFADLTGAVGDDDLILIVSARENTLSFNAALNTIPRRMSSYFSSHHFIILYPEQASLPDAYPESGMTYV